MYIENSDFATVWNLAHNWTGFDPQTTDAEQLPQEVKECIHRILYAAVVGQTYLRIKSRQIFEDESMPTFLFDIRYFRKAKKCLRQDEFDKEFLNSLYVRRASVLAWCLKDFLEPPPIWRLPQTTSAVNEAEDESETWYDNLTPNRRKRVACLEMAQVLWKLNPQAAYKEIYEHSAMKQYANPKVFSFDAFKKWARRYAPESATRGGRRI